WPLDSKVSLKAANDHYNLLIDVIFLALNVPQHSQKIPLQDLFAKLAKELV
ncbi:Hypothetical predicted protein, partial [Marmota monax]